MSDTERICWTKFVQAGYGYVVRECTTTSTVYGMSFNPRYCPECGGLVRMVTDHGKEQTPDT